MTDHAPKSPSSPSILSIIAIGFFFCAMTGAACSAVSVQGGSGVGAELEPLSAQVLTGQSQQFTATFTDPGDSASGWFVNGVPGGNSSVGTISTSGVYEAPAAVPTVAVTVSAASESDSQSTGSAPVIVVSAARKTIYCVATTGSDSNPGTLASPWLTIQHAADSVQPGDTVYVRAGVYNEAVLIRKSGSQSGGYIEFASYPGEHAVIDGTGLNPFQGQGGLIDIRNQSFVIVDGFEIRNFETANASHVPIGIFITGSGSCIKIENNHIHDIVTTVKTSAGDALGFAAYGSNGTSSINNLVISGNELDHLVTGYSESMTLNGNVQYFDVTDNLDHDNNNIGIDAIGFEHVSPVEATDQARDGIIAGNTIYNISSKDNPAYNGQYGADGLYVDGGTRIVIERNLVHNVDIGIEMASEHHDRVTSYITSRDNVVYDCNVVGLSIGGYAASVGGTEDCAAYNNTFYNDDTQRTGAGEFQIQFHASNNVIENNIFYANSQGLLVNSFVSTPTMPATLNNNLYFASTGTANAHWIWLNRTYTNFSKYIAKTGNDTDSLLTDPLFVSLTTPDFNLESTSPAIGAGRVLGSLYVGPEDFAGNPRLTGSAIDIGAYQD
jgi:hypothetical protein